MDIMTPSEFHYVMEDIKHFEPGFIENSVPVQQLMVHHQMDDSIPNELTNTNAKLPIAKKKKQKRMCDSTFNEAPTTELPCLVSYPGMYRFELHLPGDISTRRWTYSKELGKVFIDIDKVLALQFRWNYCGIKAEDEMFVRAMPVYTSHDSLNTPVTRCPIHLQPDNIINKGFKFLEHVMRCEHDSTTYEKDLMTQRLSCRTPLSRPQPGSETTTLTYKFVCKTSCVGGMNRKPICVIFTLEDVSGREFGRQHLAVKICSCPKRDKGKEETNVTFKSQIISRNVSMTKPSGGVGLSNNTSSSFSPIDAYHNVKNFAKDEITESNIIYPIPTKRPRQGVEIVKEENIGHENSMILKKLCEISDQMKSGVANENLLYRKFSRYIEAELLEMPTKSALVVQREITQIIHSTKMQLHK